MVRKRWYAWLLVPVVLVATMGADGGCDPGAHGGRPVPEKQQPAPKADPNPHRTDQIQKTYLMRIEVRQFYPHYIYVSHQMGPVRDLEEETNDALWWTEARLVPGSPMWIHVAKPRGAGTTTCDIFYVPDNRKLRWKHRRHRAIVGPGSCDATWIVDHNEDKLP